MKKLILEALKLCMEDYDKNNVFIMYENDITMRIFYVFYKNKIPICCQDQVGSHYNDLNVLGNKKEGIWHSVEVKRSNINRSFEDSRKNYPKATKWIVSFWEEMSSVPRNKTLEEIKKKIINGKHIIIHGTEWGKNEIKNLMENAKKSGFKLIKHNNLNKPKWKLLLIYSQKHKPTLEIIGYTGKN